jgi:hypothetical protein
LELGRVRDREDIQVGVCVVRRDIDELQRCVLGSTTQQGKNNELIHFLSIVLGLCEQILVIRMAGV